MVAVAMAIAVASYFVAVRNGVCWTDGCRVEKVRSAEEAWRDVQQIVEQRVTVAQRLRQEISAAGEARVQIASGELADARFATRAVPSNFFGNSWGEPLLQRIADAETEHNRLNFVSRNALGPLEVGLAPFAVPEVVARRPDNGSSMERLLTETTLLKKAVSLALERAKAAILLGRATVTGYVQALEENQSDLTAALRRYNVAASAAKGNQSADTRPFIEALEPDDATLDLDLDDAPEPEVITANDVKERYMGQARMRAMADIEAMNAQAAVLEEYARKRMGNAGP